MQIMVLYIDLIDVTVLLTIRDQEGDSLWAWIEGVGFGEGRITMRKNESPAVLNIYSYIFLPLPLYC